MSRWDLVHADLPADSQAFGGLKKRGIAQAVDSVDLGTLQTLITLSSPPPSEALQSDFRRLQQLHGQEQHENLGMRGTRSASRPNTELLRRSSG